MHPLGCITYMIRESTNCACQQSGLVFCCLITICLILYLLPPSKLSYEQWESAPLSEINFARIRHRVHKQPNPLPLLRVLVSLCANACILYPTMETLCAANPLITQQLRVSAGSPTTTLVATYTQWWGMANHSPSSDSSSRCAWTTASLS